MPPRDKHEDVVVEQLESDGWDVITVGQPDIIALKDSRIKFIEVKTGNNTLQKSQIQAHKTLKKHGFSVEVIRINPGATIRVSYEIRDSLKSQRKRKANGDLETIEEVLLRVTQKGGLDLQGRKIGTG